MFAEDGILVSIHRRVGGGLLLLAKPQRPLPTFSLRQQPTVSSYPSAGLVAAVLALRRVTLHPTIRLALVRPCVGAHIHLPTSGPPHHRLLSVAWLPTTATIALRYRLH